MLLVNPLTALAFFDIAKHNKNKAIINAPAVGALGRMIDFLRKKNHIPVINIVRNEKQLNTLIARGSRNVLNGSKGYFYYQLRVLSHDLNVTLALDAVGGKLTQLILEAIPYGGSVIMYGNLSGEQSDIDFRALVMENKHIAGFYLENWIKDYGLTKTIRNTFAVKRLLKNEMKISVQNRFPLENAQQAIDAYLNNMSDGKILLVPNYNYNATRKSMRLI